MEGWGVSPQGDSQTSGASSDPDFHEEETEQEDKGEERQQEPGQRPSRRFLFMGGGGRLGGSTPGGDPWIGMACHGIHEPLSGARVP